MERLHHIARENGKNQKKSDTSSIQRKGEVIEPRKRGFEESDDSVDIAGRLGWTTCHEELDDQGS